MSNDALNDLRRFGVAEAELARFMPAAAASESRDITIEVEPENHDAVQLYRHMQTQWRTSPIVAGKHLIVLRTGFDYSALGPIAAMLHIAPDGHTMEALKQMELEALEIHGRRQREQLSRS